MAIKLNLLPEEHAVNNSLSSFLKTAKALGVIGIAAFLIFGVGLGIFFILSTISLNSVNANVAKLTSRVEAQQKSEQQIVLVKDRIKKVASIQDLPNSLPNLKAIDAYLVNLSGTGSVGQLTVDPKGANLTLSLRTYSDLTNFLENIQSSDDFGSVSLESFSLNSKTGYSVEIKTTKK